MSGGKVCKCPESKKPIKERRWGVVDRNCNYSAFSGYHKTYSDYSSLVCLECRAYWRTKAAYVYSLDKVEWDDSIGFYALWSKKEDENNVHNEKRETIHTTERVRGK